MNLPEIEANLRANKRAISFKFFSVKLYIFVMKSIAIIGSILIILIPSFFIVPVSNALEKPILLLFLVPVIALAEIFYAANVAFPDFCSCLVSIEANLKNRKDNPSGNDAYFTSNTKHSEQN